MVSEDLVLKFSRAIAKEEGFYVPNSVPNRAHNPGDLTDDGDVGFGVVQTSGPHGAKITIYPNESAGWAALYKKVRRMLNGASHTYTIDLTIMEVAIKWSGDPAWARNVAAVLGVDTRTTLAMIVDADLKRQGGATEA
jgi:hypothetical protein